MPIYDYHCDHCGHTFSQVQSYADATLEVCPNCGKKPRKLMATPAIVFKGGGWYKTDSRPAQKDASKEGTKESGDTAKGDTDKADKADKSDKTDKADKKAEPAAKADAPKADTSKADKPAPAAKGEGKSS
jgi:putative FmdB family regulatory protein